MAASTLLSGLGSIFGAFARNNNISDSLQAQKEENQKNRQFNLMLARLQNQWQKEMWRANNQYNSPANTMRLLREGGLNPDLAMSKGSAFGSASAPQMTSGNPSNPMDYSALAQKVTVGDVVSSALQNEAVSAGISKTRSETEGQDISNAWSNLTNERSLKLIDGQITLIGTQSALNGKQQSLMDSQIQQLNAATGSLQASISATQASISKMDVERAAIELSMHLNSKKVDAEIKQMAASSSLSYAQAKEITTLLSSKLLNLNTQSVFTRSQINKTVSETESELLRQVGIGIQNQQLQFNLDSDRQFKDLERSVGTFETITRGVGNIIRSFNPFNLPTTR